MFDNLRDTNSGDDFFKDDSPQSRPEAAASVSSRRSRSKNFLGMTALQRFILAVMLLFVVILLGSLFLLVTGSVVLPF